MNRPSYFKPNLNEGTQEVTTNSSNPIFSIECKPYRCVIKKVEDNQEKEALIIYFDIIDQPLANVFTNDALNNGGKWSRRGMIWQSYSQENMERFEGFITAVRKSNQNFVWDWDEQKLVGKLMVVVYGEEEFLTKDTKEIKISIKPRIVRSIEALNSGKIEPVSIKRLSQTNYGNRNYQPNGYQPNYQSNNNYGNYQNNNYQNNNNYNGGYQNGGYQNPNYKNTFQPTYQQPQNPTNYQQPQQEYNVEVDDNDLPF